MQKHVKNYLQYFDIGEQDVVSCEACGKSGRIDNGFDIHHIHGRIGNDADEIKNIILLCRSCHERAHSSKNHVTPDEFQYIHNCYLTGKRQTFLK
jgi:hypothetical protein